VFGTRELLYTERSRKRVAEAPLAGFPLPLVAPLALGGIGELSKCNKRLPNTEGPLTVLQLAPVE